MTTCHDTSSWGSANAADKTQFHRIVVGVDGSPNSVAALQLAVGLADREGATLEAVYAYHPYVAAQYPFAGALPPYGMHGEGTQDTADPATEPINAATDSLELLKSTLYSVLKEAEVDKIAVRAIEGDPNDVLASAGRIRRPSRGWRPRPQRTVGLAARFHRAGVHPARDLSGAGRSGALISSDHGKLRGAAERQNLVGTLSAGQPVRDEQHRALVVWAKNLRNHG